MNPTKRRHVASWMLLAVFVPIVLFSSLHVHDSHAGELSECIDCVAHHCSGHIAQTDSSFDDCVLCQFLSLTFVAASATAFSLVFNIYGAIRAQLPAAVCVFRRGSMVTRGPPAL